MSLIPNTTCRRCHRQYAAFRSRCPYCGTKKVREVRSAVPETDSAVPGTQASRSAAEAVNWQMLIGGVLLLAVVAATIVLVSVNVNDAADLQKTQDELQDMTVTPLPLPTGTPEPTASPMPAITSVEVRWGADGIYDYAQLGYFTFPKDQSIDLVALWYPNIVTAVPEWSIDDESIVTIAPDGINCRATMVGEVGDSTVMHVNVNGIEKSWTINITNGW